MRAAVRNRDTSTPKLEGAKQSPNAPVKLSWIQADVWRQSSELNIKVSHSITHGTISHDARLSLCHIPLKQHTNKQVLIQVYLVIMRVKGWKTNLIQNIAKWKVGVYLGYIPCAMCEPKRRILGYPLYSNILVRNLKAPKKDITNCFSIIPKIQNCNAFVIHLKSLTQEQWDQSHVVLDYDHSASQNQTSTPQTRIWHPGWT